ncbi:MAG: MraY family glycosyltransferase [Treponema sp.]|nr:MraY family glycosyltransferase [Treponema sp.]
MLLYLCIGLSVFISLVSMPVIITFCKHFKLFDYQNARKIHSGDIPRLGGIGIILSFLISVSLYLILSKDISFSKHFPLILAITIIFVFAIIDDIINLPAYIKLIIQLIAVSIVCFNGYRFTTFFGFSLPPVLSFIITFGWILGLINAYNLIDGLDGLCGSLSLTTILTFGILFSYSNNEVSEICFILVAAIFGFLCFNWPPAKLFMGDNGSQTLGFIIAVIPLYTSNDVFEYNKILIVITLTALPLFDMIAAIWRRLRDKKPIMSPDRSHLHHKLLNLGYSSKSSLLMMVSLQILICVSIVISYYLGNKKGTALLIELLCFIILFFSIVHFSNRNKIKSQDIEKTQN